MIEHEDRMFADFLREGPERGPADGPAHVFERTRQMRQRPAWSFLSRWTGAMWPGQRIVAPALLAIVLLLLLAIAAVLVVGGGRHRGAPLTGPAANGLLAWDTGQGGQVFLAGPDGADPHPILGPDPITRTPSFSRDGTMFVFWSRANTDPATKTDIYAANADGTNVHKINGNQQADVNILSYPNWSPDGVHVVYSSLDGDVNRLYVATVDGSAPPKAITGSDAIRDSPAWSPDGQWIAFRKQTLGDNRRSSLALMRPDGTGERELWSVPTPPEAGPYDALPGGPVWAPDSSAIAYARLGDGTSDNELPWHAYLAVRPLDGPERKLYEDSYGTMSWPDWSPDGRWIAVGLGDSAPGQVIIARPDGSERRTVTRDLKEGGNCGVAWAPDARSVLVQCAGFPRYALDDLEHPVNVPLPSGASGPWIQRAPLP